MSTSPLDPYVPPAVEQRAPRPPGLLPRNTQPWVIVGIALVMVIVIALSGTGPTSKPKAPALPEAPVMDPNQERIQEYRARIDEQARRLALEQSRLAQTRQAALGTPGPTSNAASSGDVGLGNRPVSGETSSLMQVREEIAAERIKRDYFSRFSSNLVLSHRPSNEEQANSSSVSNAVATAPSQPPAEGTSSGDSGSPKAAEPSDKTYRVMEGTVIETTLANRLDGAFSGPVKCLVTTNVYSHDRLWLLIPQGTEVLGEVKAVESFGQQRLSVRFHRLIRPDGYSVELKTAPGLNQVGETGLVDRVNRHYLQIFGVSLAIGAIAGFSQANTAYGSEASASDVYRQGVASSLSQSSLNVLDRFLNVLPTHTIREGHRVKVFLTADLELPAYEKRRLPGF